MARTRLLKDFPPLWIALLVLLLEGMLFITPGPARPRPAIAAQSTGDSLPTHTPPATATPLPVATPTPSPAPARQIWVGRLVDNILGATQGQGSIFRVSVEGLPGTRIELRSGGALIAADAGSKPELGPFAAEFAPVTKGTWTVSVPALGASTDVAADNYNLAIIQFVQVPETEATATIQPPPTATPLGGLVWEGRLAGQTPGAGAPSARLLVQVVGLKDQPVRLSTLAEIINTANTGQKPDELGPDVVEFAGLSPGQYIIEPMGLNSRFDVDLKINTVTRVEFHPQQPSPTATSTPAPLPPPPTYTPAPPTAPPMPTVTATSTATPRPTLTPTPNPTPTPLASPTPVSRWLGRVAGRQSSGSRPGSLTVRVAGSAGLPVHLRPLAAGPALERRCVTGQDQPDLPDGCVFDELAAGQYAVAPVGLGLSLPVTLGEHEAMSLVFEQATLPPGILGWQARLVQNTNGFQAASQNSSTIRVRTTGPSGAMVALRSARGTEQFCEVGRDPALGNQACEFDRLGPGVYLVEALHTGAGFRLFVDGTGLAEVAFTPDATYATLALTQAPPVAGHGARPTPPTATPGAVEVASIADQVPPASVPPTPTVDSTPTPILAWQGRVVDVVDGVAGAVGVRAVGLKDHPVLLRSGNWESGAQLTGAKPELGDYAVEFGGLAQGEYTIELVDLAQFTVRLGPGQFVLVEFQYGPLVSP